jgi:uncharacterized protein YeaO (DUF488 family)
MVAKASSAVKVRRVYEPNSPQDGQRILVDRLWPRGLRKADLEGVAWMKEVAPSAELRKWFGHRPERWPVFRDRYFKELEANPAVDVLRRRLAAGPVTLLYGAHDQEHNQAVALAEYLQGRSQSPS